MCPEPRKIKAKDILADIRNGLSDQELMDKHQIPPKALPGVFQKLIKTGLLSASEFDNRVLPPELNEVAATENRAQILTTPLTDFLDHFIRRLVDKNQTGSSDADESFARLEDCLSIKQSKVADLAMACLKAGDTIGAHKALSLLDSRSPESRSTKQLRSKLELAYKTKTLEMFDSCWKRGQLTECGRVLKLLKDRFPHSPLTRFFEEEFQEKPIREAEDIIEHYISINNLEAAYRAVLKFKKQFPHEKERMEFFSEDEMPRLKAIKVFDKKWQAFPRPGQEKIRKIFHWLGENRPSKPELRFLSSPVEAFNESYPGMELHPAVQRIVRIIHYLFYKIQDSISDIDILRIPRILERVALNNDLFAGLPDIQATRLWHLLSVEQMIEDNVKTYCIVTPLDDASCGVCSVLHGQEINIKDVIQTVERSLCSSEKNYFFNDRFPKFNELQLMAPAEITEYLLKQGWIAPPFYHNCRCWILPLT